MKPKKQKSWYDQALDAPTSIYRNPTEVLADKRLDEAGMRAILTAWEHDARRLMESADEGMTGGEPPLLRDVQSAVAELDRRKKETGPLSR